MPLGSEGGRHVSATVVHGTEMPLTGAVWVGAGGPCVSRAAGMCVAVASGGSGGGGSVGCAGGRVDMAVGAAGRVEVAVAWGRVLLVGGVVASGRTGIAVPTTGTVVCADGGRDGTVTLVGDGCLGATVLPSPTRTRTWAGAPNSPAAFAARTASRYVPGAGGVQPWLICARVCPA